MTNKPTKGIFKRDLALLLIKYGAKLVDTKPNRHRPSYDVYYFEVDDKFNSLMKILGK